MIRTETETKGLPLADESMQLQVREVIKEVRIADLRMIAIGKTCNNLTAYEKAQLQHCSTLLRMIDEILQSYDVPF